jgi:hypothetical protein
MNIVHIGSATVFMPPFIRLMETTPFNKNKHFFFLSESISTDEIVESSRVKLIKGNIFKKIAMMLELLSLMKDSDKVILHGLFDPKVILLLFFNRKVLKKTYWVLWGGDLYCYKFCPKNWKNKLRYFFLGSVIKNIGNIITYIKGDYCYAVEWFGSKANYHECIMYSSNLYKEYKAPSKQHSGINIQVGNSADPSNNHLEIFDKLEAFKEQDIKIYAPLSYGNQVYAKQVIAEGKKRFSDKFEALTEIMSFDQYLAFLGKIDIAVFNHKHQQAMGNTITLLGLGKKVYMRSDVTQWEFFKEHGMVIFDIENFKLTPMPKESAQTNILYTKDYFSEENYQQQLSEVFQ